MAEARSREPVLSEMAAAGPRMEPAQNPASSVRQLHQILDASTESVVCIDRTWHCTFVNQAARTILKADDLMGANLWTRFPLNQEEPFASNYRATMEQRVPTDFEAHYPEPLNIWFKVSARPYDGGMIIFSSDITLRKRAEQLRNTDARLLEQVLEATSDAVVSLDRNFNYSFLNRQARLLLGRDDLLGKNLWLEFPSTEADVPLRRTMEERIALEFEVFNPAPLNRWFRVQTRPSEDGIVVFFRDVTEERAAQQILLDQQATLAFVQQTARVATWEIECVTRRLTLSKGSFPVWGRAPEEVATVEDFYAILHPEDRPRLIERHRTMAKGYEFPPVDYRVIGPDGEIIWLEGRSVAVCDDSGAPTHLRGLTIDITARKNAEALRDAASRQLEQVLEATTDAVISVDRHWTVTFANPQAVRMLGRSDLVGKNVWEEFPAAVESQIYLRYHETMETGQPCDFEEYYPEPLNLWVSIQCRASAEGMVIFSHSTTEEHRARQKLLDQQTTLAFVQEAARIATWTVDLTTESMQIGEGSYPVFGRPNEEIQTLSDFRQLVLGDGLTSVRAGVAQAVTTGRVGVADYQVAAPDGSAIWLEGRCLAVADEAGEMTRLRGMTTDITARMEHEQKLRASEERYRVLADLNPQTLWIGEPDGTISYTNQGHADYRGVEPEALLGARWLEGIYPQDREEMVRAWTHSLGTGDEYSVEARILSREGQFRWWALRALPVRDQAGHILNWLGVAHDIHDMKSVTEELRTRQEETERQRAELETIYRTAPIALSVYDPVEFRYLRANDHLCEALGRPIDQIVGHKAGSFGNIAAGFRDAFREASNGRTVRDYVVEGDYANGEHRFYTINCAPIYASDGTVQAIACASLNITQQKKAEAALIQSEKLAAVGRLASSISHEINNPLEAITNLLYLVATDKHLHESVKAYVHLAQSELSRVSQIATQTLRFHRQAVKPTMVTGAELVESVLGLYQGRLNNSDILVEATYSSNTAVFCFENDLRQVLNNLIANAIDAMRTGGRLIVRAHEVTDWLASNGTSPRKGIRITVADTGHGMSPAVQARIFEPFYTTKDLNGTGLGLWISSGIMQHHKGRLTVRSSQNPRYTGTVFTLFLPLGVEAAEGVAS